MKPDVHLLRKKIIRVLKVSLIQRKSSRTTVESEEKNILKAKIDLWFQQN